jgi:hypothetical protein
LNKAKAPVAAHDQQPELIFEIREKNLFFSLTAMKSFLAEKFAKLMNNFLLPNYKLCYEIG